MIDKKKIIEGIKQISKIIGKNNVYVRYDPIFVNEKYTIEYHKRAFEKLCSSLEGFINGFIVSFIDDYKNVQKNKEILNIKELTEKDYEEIGLSFAESANNHHTTVQTCSEEKTLFEYGFIRQDCVTSEMIYGITQKKFNKKWQARKNDYCNCVEMVDIGVYNSCMHLCKYCYANFDEDKVKNNYSRHSDESSLLVGYLKEDDIIKRRSI